MDELIIGEKKYVSSKQAAKVTGYAKDYIGQLCREGRVPARLVGRSWYVLESAIHDHRFGEQKTKEEKEATTTSPLPTWESPRYEAASTEVLPSVNRLKDAGETPADDQGEDSEFAQRLQDSWRAWFDHVADVAPSIPDVVPEKREESGGKEADVEVEEVNVPIHTVYERPPEELLPRSYIDTRVASEPEEEERAPHNAVRRFGTAFQVVGASLALVMAILAVVGTGYFDEFIISNSQVGMIAGVSLYNR